MENIKQLTDQIGFWHTLNILGEEKSKSMSLKDFYKKLLEVSYYNAFIRVKDDLIKHGIIFIKKINKKKTIGLKEKGITILVYFNILNYLIGE